MTFTVRDGECYIGYRSGRVERCEDISEMREVCHMAVELGRLLGKLPSLTEREARGREGRRALYAGDVCREVALSSAKKKKVRIYIDPDVEIIRDLV